MGVGLARLAGYRDALLGHRAVRRRLVAYGDFSEAQRRGRACASCWTGSPDLDAVFAASDLMALGAMRVLREAGRGCPTTSRWSASTTRPPGRRPPRR